MTEENLKQYIKGQRANKSTEDPFKVPEGYFGTLCGRIMAQLPEQQNSVAETQEKKAVRRTLIPRVWRYAAVIAIGAVVCLGVLIPNMSGSSEAEQLAESSVVQEMEQAYYDDQYLNDALEYAMVDNNEIALYLTEY